MVRRKLQWILVSLLTFVIAQSAMAGDQDFELFNRTGFDIHALYVSPTGVDSWEEDVLGADVLLKGASIDINFSREEEAQFWDIRVEDAEGNFIVWKKIDLLSAYQVILEPNGVARIKDVEDEEDE